MSATRCLRPCTWSLSAHRDIRALHAYVPPPPQPLDAVYIEKPGLDPFGQPLAGAPPAQEVHRFLVHLPSELPGGGCWKRWWAREHATRAMAQRRPLCGSQQQLCQVLLLLLLLLHMAAPPSACTIPHPHHAGRLLPALLDRADGQPIRSERDRKAIYEVVKAHLMGTSVQQQALLAAASGAAGPAGSAPLGMPAVGGSLHDPQQQSILVSGAL